MKMTILCSAKVELSSSVINTKNKSKSQVGFQSKYWTTLKAENKGDIYNDKLI